MGEPPKRAWLHAQQQIEATGVSRTIPKNNPFPKYKRPNADSRAGAFVFRMGNQAHT